MDLRRRICYLLSLLKIHSRECVHCHARETGGDDMLKRLEELDWRTRQSLLENGKIPEVRDPKPPTRQ